MKRRTFIQGLAALGVVGSLPLPLSRALAANIANPVSVDDLPKLKGELTLYLGRGEGGLYENVLQAIQKRNPDFKLGIRRGPTAALANTIVAEAKAGVKRADIFWAVDSGAIGLVTDAGLAQKIPTDLSEQLQPQFRYKEWAPVTGRIRTLPYNTSRLTKDQIPTSIMEIADSDLSIGWAPAYASFQSFVTAMRILEGDHKTAKWLKKVQKRSKTYAGELGVVMGVERGEVDIGFANHYYTLRLKSGKPNAKLDLAFTQNDAGCLVNASGVLALNDDPLATNFMRYLLSKEVQGYLATEAYEIPLINNISQPDGLPSLANISPPKIDLTQLADLRPTIDLMRNNGVL
ncbi:Ferric iron ABC transporter, iron-binding protein [Pseudoalteromonas carrageenovora]|uniref:ABC transporter substrate-binding protein n=1 Tax=Pseudoalteromonas carrageenovora IAM 12662 TaxID=1314868 RepID=A0A2K4X9K8_PSEVC|nr:extracellular solute-binding protein [Pseudoalteromonas carrageenovora]MBE0383338.1 iron(III) transport system substrate-binding protein [Pseudoalteromonas carrageenovora IAM 12662]QBJ71894.1 Ferric iron ABC transporter, iron-binding protein [Pseudoalteromonas carrageenovora]GEB70108.1 iron ABC transporter substrate-binding protein [Pseudoalteromonas carrageenovora]SOU40996.1 ABC transporter substrate-binding protein [Pseudoalteromonas carrageenovora IAM 12662]